MSDMFDTIIEVNIAIALNTDNKKKYVGDLVRVWDFSTCTDMFGDEYIGNREEFMKHEFIVVAEDQNSYIEYGSGISVYNDIQDLIIADIETKEEFRISSDGVALIK